MDSNVPFYVGIGKQRIREPNSYERAFSKRSRNKYWLNIENKTPIRIDILFESNSREVIEEKEKEFIQLYGRKDIKTGILVNQTDGGDGMQGGGVNRHVPVYCYSYEGNYLQSFASVQEASAVTDTNKADISACCRGRRVVANRFQWRYEKVEKLPPLKIKRLRCKDSWHKTQKLQA